MSFAKNLIVGTTLGISTYLMAGSTGYAQELKARGVEASDPSGPAAAPTQGSGELGVRPGRDPAPSGKPAAAQPATCPPQQQCPPAPQKKVGPSRTQKQLGRLESELRDWQGRVAGLAEVTQTNRQVISDMITSLESYATIRQTVENLQKSAGLTYLTGIVNNLFADLTGQKDAMLRTCGQAYGAHRKVAEGENAYLAQRKGLNDQVLALQAETTLTDQQRTERATSLRAQIEKLEQEYRVKDGAVKKLTEECADAQRGYDWRAARLRGRIEGNLAHRLDPRKWSVEPHADYLNFGGASAAAVGADVCAVGKKGRLCVGAEAVGGQPVESESSSAEATTSPVGSGYQQLTLEQSETEVQMRYLAGAGVSAWTRDFRPRNSRRFSVAAGVGATAYRGEEKSTTETMRTTQLSDAAGTGNLVGDAQVVTGEETSARTVYSVVPRAQVDLCYKNRVCLEGKLGVDSHTKEVVSSGGLRFRF